MQQRHREPMILWKQYFSFNQAFCVSVSFLLFFVPVFVFPFNPSPCLDPPRLQGRWLATTPAWSSTTLKRELWPSAALFPASRPASSATCRALGTARAAALDHTHSTTRCITAHSESQAQLYQPGPRRSGRTITPMWCWPPGLKRVVSPLCPQI